IFWMWVIALLAGAIKFSEVVLAVHYREKNELGEYIGGPMYYITKGLGMKWLGVWFAIAMMVEVGASIMVQGNSLALSVRETFNNDEHCILCRNFFSCHNTYRYVDRSIVSYFWICVSTDSSCRRLWWCSGSAGCSMGFCKRCIFQCGRRWNGSNCLSCGNNRSRGKARIMGNYCDGNR